jgi:hypothetical protein
MLILCAVLIVVLNAAYYQYGHQFFRKQKVKIEQNMTVVNGEVAIAIVAHSKGLEKIEKIVGLKREIAKSEARLENLKDKIQTDVQVTEVLEALILENGIQVEEIVLTDETTDNLGTLYLFKVGVKGKMPQLLRLIDSLEHKNELFLLKQYTILPEEQLIRMDMNISTVYMEPVQ